MTNTPQSDSDIPLDENGRRASPHRFNKKPLTPPPESEVVRRALGERGIIDLSILKNEKKTAAQNDTTSAASNDTTSSIPALSPERFFRKALDGFDEADPAGLPSALHIKKNSRAELESKKIKYEARIQGPNPHQDPFHRERALLAIISLLLETDTATYEDAKAKARAQFEQAVPGEQFSEGYFNTSYRELIPYCTVP